MIVYTNELGGLVLLAEKFKDSEEGFKIWEEVLDNVEQMDGKMFRTEEEALT